MKKILTPTLLAIAVLISACATTPRTTGLLDQTRSDFAIARNNPDVERYAPLELQQANEAMNLANAASSHDESAENINKLAYIAKSKIAVANEVTKQKLAQAEIAKTAKERDHMILNQRTLEADNANLTAQAALASAADSQRKTADAQAQAADAQAQAALLQVQLAALSAKQTERGMVITMGDVLFGTNLSNLNSNGMTTAHKLADVLSQNPQRRVLIEGYTDSTGSVDYNQELSERRAQSVRTALQELGIAPDRIAIRGYGKNFPVAPNDNAADRQMNRRVEIVLSDADGKIIARQ